MEPVIGSLKKNRIIMPGISNLNKTTASENFTETEIQIIVIKECVLAICITLQFNKVPGIIVIEIILFVVLWLNTFHNVGGISKL